MLGPVRPAGCYRMVDILAMRTYTRLALHVKNVAFVKKNFSHTDYEEVWEKC